MIKLLSYSTISLVSDSWDALRRQSNYEEEAGTKLFTHLFANCPQAKVLFGFPIDTDPTSPELHASKRFKMHASYMIQMLDTAISMLGPDIELLSEILAELGAKHTRYGVKAEFFPFMGESLIAALCESLSGSIMTPAAVEAWKVTYGSLSKEMMGQTKVSKKLSKQVEL